jgi:hypothetical protein
MKAIALLSILITVSLPLFSAADTLLTVQEKSSSTVSPPLSSATDPLPEMIEVEVEVKSEQLINGQNETNVISAPRVVTRGGSAATVKVGEPFTTEVQGYEDITKQAGVSGLILTVTPTSIDSFILLKGTVQLPGTLSLKLLEENGAVAIQESCNIQFSIKVMDGVPFEIEPVDMPDGSKLFITFKALKADPEMIKKSGEKLLQEVRESPNSLRAKAHAE